MATQRPNKQEERVDSSSSKEADPPSAMAESRPAERQMVTNKVVKTAIGLAVAAIVLYLYVPIPVPPLPTKIHQFLYTFRLQTPAFLILFAAILNVGQIRLHTPAIDPIGGQSEHHVLFANRFLTNHVEQMLLNIPGQLILTSFLEERQMKIIPILVMFFVFGRVAFYIGYKQSYLKRSVGFTASFLPSGVMWLCNAFLLVRALITNEAIQM